MAVAIGRIIRGMVRSSTRLGREAIRTANWMLDLGPEGGDKPVLSVAEGGGEVVAEGTPETVARAERSYTGRYLAPLLGQGEARLAAK